MSPSSTATPARPCDEIRAAIAERGWAAVVSSTHSHLSARTRAKRSHWDKFRARWPGQDAAADQDLAVAFLRREKGYLPRIAEGARLVEETDEFAVFEHAPCPKFRIAVPLLRPWRAEDYGDQRAANAAWKEAVEALAAALRLDHDQSCTDTSRRVLPAPPPAGRARARVGGAGRRALRHLRPAASGPGRPIRRCCPSRIARARARAKRKPATSSTRATGEVFDLVAWARRLGATFEIEKALRARRPEVFVGKTADGVKHHIRCVERGRAHAGRRGRRDLRRQRQREREPGLRPTTAGTPTATAATACSSCAGCWSADGSPPPIWTIRFQAGSHRERSPPRPSRLPADATAAADGRRRRRSWAPDDRGPAALSIGSDAEIARFVVRDLERRHGPVVFAKARSGATPGRIGRRCPRRRSGWRPALRRRPVLHAGAGGRSVKLSKTRVKSILALMSPASRAPTSSPSRGRHQLRVRLHPVR